MITLNITCKQKSNSWMYILNLYASIFLSMGPKYFYQSTPWLSQGIPHISISYGERSWLPSPVFYLAGHCLSSPGRVCAAKLFLWQNTMHLLWNIWSPLYSGCPYGGWFSWGLEKSGPHRDWTKFCGFLFLVVQARQQRSSLLHCAWVQGNCQVKKEQGPSSRTSGTFIFNLSRKHGDLQTLLVTL